MTESVRRKRWHPSMIQLLSIALVIAGFILTSQSWWFFLLAALGTFGPGVLREIGWLQDQDEFQRQADHRAGYHAFLVTGLLMFVCVAFVRSHDRPIEEAQEFVAAMISKIADSESLMDTLVEMIESASYHCSHSMAVSMYAGLIYGMRDSPKEEHRSTLALAGLFHDIGLSDEVVRKKHCGGLESEKEVLQDERHTVKSKKLLSEKREFSSDILRLVLEHHEDGLGWGPNSIKAADQHPLSAILFVANDFCSMTLRPESPCHPREALEQMRAKATGFYNPIYLDKLESLLRLKSDRRAA